MFNTNCSKDQMKCIILLKVWTGEHAHKLTMLVRAINYNLGKQTFTIVFITSLEGIVAISEAIKMDGDKIQNGVVGIVSGTFLHIHTYIYIYIYIYI